MRSIWVDGDRTRVVDVTPLPGGRARVTIDGVALEVAATPLDGGRMRLVHEGAQVTAVVTAEGARRFVRIGSADYVLERSAAARPGRPGRAVANRLESPMPGVVTRVMVAVGDDVKKGQTLLAIEAMKMEHAIRAPRDGKVVALRARSGEMVQGGVPLVELDGGEGES